MTRHPNLALERSLSIAFVATCPPRQCGIATFSSDLERALKASDPSVLIQWAAINEASPFIHTDRKSAGASVRGIPTVIEQQPNI